MDIARLEVLKHFRLAYIDIHRAKKDLPWERGHLTRMRTDIPAINP